MKKMLAVWALLLVGALMVTTAVIMWTILPGKAQKVPYNTTQKTLLAGEAKKYNAETGKTDVFPVKVANFTEVDGVTSSDDVVVWTSVVCVNKDEGQKEDCLRNDPRVVEIQTQTFATDRHTGEAVPDYAKLPKGTKRYEGLMNKFPFNTEKKNYTYWDDTLNKPLTAKYEGTEDFDGVEVYKFVVAVDNVEAAVADLGDGPIMGTYTSNVQIFIEPKTGAPLNQIQHQERYLEDGTQVIDLTVEFTDAQKKQSIAEAKDNVKMLGIFSGPIPVILFVVGLLAIALAGFLLFRQNATGKRVGNA